MSEANQNLGEPGVATGADPRAYARILWRWKFLLLAIIVIIPLATYLYERGRPKVYQSSVLLDITGGQQTGIASLFNQQLVQGPDTTDLLADARLITTTGVATQAAKYLHPAPPSPGALLGSVSASADQNTGFITITASDGHPRRAANIANAFALAVSVEQTRALNGQIRVAIGQLKKQLASLPRTDPGRGQLSQEISRFRALRAAQSTNAQIVQAATPASVPVAPLVSRSVILALIVAMLLGVGAVAIAEASDRRLRHPDDIGDAAALPLLSAIPREAFSSNPPSRVVEAFATLRAALTYFNVDRQISSILVTSPGKEDGKSTVSIQLARSLARAGGDVILLDADLRRATVAKRLDIPPRPGLGAVLIGKMSTEEALVSEPASNGRGGSLRILPAGPPPPNPAELLSSRRMQALLTELTNECDMLIIDSTPLLTVSDSMALVPLVSGVVIVGRVNRTSREAISRLRFVIDSAGGHPLGVVATGTKAGGLYAAPGYGYESYVSEAGAAGFGARHFKFPGRSRAQPEQVLADESE